MSDLDDVLTALKEADKVGNTEDAIKFADMAERLSVQTPTIPEVDIETKTGGFAPFVSRGITSALGVPAEAGASLLEELSEIGTKAQTLTERAVGVPETEQIPTKFEDPFGGRKSIERGFEAIGTRFPEEEAVPETLPEFAGRGVGEVVGALIPFTKASQFLSTGKGLVGKISKTILDSITKSPFLSATSEVTGGAGAGTGRYIAEQADVSPAVKSTAEIVGGVVGGLAPVAGVGIIRKLPTAIGLRKGTELIKKASLPFTERGAKFRAGEFLKKQVVSPEETAKAVTDPTIGELPPVIAAKEKKLISLYNQLRKASPETDAEAIKRISRSTYKLEQELRGLGYGAPEVLKDVTNKRVASIELRMNKRVTDAMETAQNRLDKLPVAQRRAQESIIVRNELEKARKVDVVDNKALWADVPKDVKVDFNGSRDKYAEILSGLSKAEKTDIPPVLKNSFLAKKMKIPEGEAPQNIAEFLKTKADIDDAPTITTIKEMQGLRSKLLETQRMARKDGKWNKARIAGEMADSLLDDMDLGTDDALSVAINSTRQLKQKYESGVVGKILGLEKSGAPAIAPELTLDISVGRAGIKGGLDIENVAVTPEAMAATKRYINRSFTDYATDKGTKSFNATKAQKWIANNEEILEQFPELKTQMQDINNAQQIATDTLATMTARKQRLRDPRISISGQFLNKELGQEIPNIMKSANPEKATMELVRQARKDPTGEAMEGLKGAYVEHIIESSSKGAYNELGEQTLSGNALTGFINKNRNVLRSVFEQKEIVRLEKIGKELSLLERIDKIKGDRIDLEIDDLPSNFLRTMSRVAGAQLGRWVAGKTGGGTVQTPAIFSERLKGVMQRFTKDKAQQLVYDAITSEDGKLLKALLLPIDKPQVQAKNLKELNRALNIWLLGSGSRVMQDTEKEMLEEQGMLQERPEGSQSTLGGR